MYHHAITTLLSCLAVVELYLVFCYTNIQMYTLSAPYSESFQKKKLAMAKLFHEKPLQVSDKLVQLYSFSYNINLCQKIWEEVVISILIHVLYLSSLVLLILIV